MGQEEQANSDPARRVPRVPVFGHNPGHARSPWATHLPGYPPTTRLYRGLNSRRHLVLDHLAEAVTKPVMGQVCPDCAHLGLEARGTGVHQ